MISCLGKSYFLFLLNISLFTGLGVIHPDGLMHSVRLKKEIYLSGILSAYTNVVVSSKLFKLVYAQNALFVLVLFTKY